MSGSGGHRLIHRRPQQRRWEGTAGNKLLFEEVSELQDCVQLVGCSVVLTSKAGHCGAHFQRLQGVEALKAGSVFSDSQRDIGLGSLVRLISKRSPSAGEKLSSL